MFPYKVDDETRNQSSNVYVFLYIIKNDTALFPLSRWCTELSSTQFQKGLQTACEPCKYCQCLSTISNEPRLCLQPAPESAAAFPLLSPDNVPQLVAWSRVNTCPRDPLYSPRLSRNCLFHFLSAFVNFLPGCLPSICTHSPIHLLMKSNLDASYPRGFFPTADDGGKNHSF